MATIRLHGKVFSGKGEGTRYTQLQWVKKQITEKCGFIPHDGTLNIKLTEESFRTKKQLETANAMEISPPEGFCRGKCFRARIKCNVKCVVLIPEIASYPEDIVEIVAPINLRKELRLKDGDEVDVTILV